MNINPKIERKIRFIMVFICTGITHHVEAVNKLTKGKPYCVFASNPTVSVTDSIDDFVGPLALIGPDLISPEKIIYLQAAHMSCNVHEDIFQQIADALNIPVEMHTLGTSGVLMEMRTFKPSGAIVTPAVKQVDLVQEAEAITPPNDSNSSNSSVNNIQTGNDLPPDTNSTELSKEVVSNTTTTVSTGDSVIVDNTYMVSDKEHKPKKTVK